MIKEKWEILRDFKEEFKKLLKERGAKIEFHVTNVSPTHDDGYTSKLHGLPEDAELENIGSTLFNKYFLPDEYIQNQ